MSSSNGVRASYESVMETSESDAGTTNPSASSANSEVSQDVVDDVREPRMNFKPVFRKEHLYYDMSGEKYLIIFNHFKFQASRFYRFQAPPQRNGTDEDVRVLKIVFGKLGFKVLVYPDFTHEQILDQMARISRQDHTRTSCLAVAILTHGETKGTLCAADRTYNLKEITNLLEYGSPTLVNKPKLFFIQACRGDKVDDGRTVQTDGPGDEEITVPSHSDFLFLYSTVEDFLSWRDSGGSWLIQEFCDVLKNYSEDFDLLHLVTLTIRNVGYNRSSNVPKDKKFHDKKQSPEARFTLTKLVQFSQL